MYTFCFFNDFSDPNLTIILEMAENLPQLEHSYEQYSDEFTFGHRLRTLLVEIIEMHDKEHINWQLAFDLYVKYKTDFDKIKQNQKTWKNRNIATMNSKQ